MPIEELLQAISTVGFPIACTLAMGYYVTKQNQNFRDDVRAMEETHREESKSFQECLNNNTIALVKLCEKLDNHLEDDLK